MKKLAGLVAIILTIGSSAFAKGTDKPKDKTVTGENVSVSLIPYANNKGISLKAANETKEDVSVAIYDTAGETVFTEVVQNTPSIVRNYNLTSLPNGVYTVSVTTENYTVTKSLDVR